MKRILIVALLSGCAAPSGPVIVEGTPNQVMVNWADSNKGTRGVLTMAEAHCSKFGKTAQYTGNANDFTMVYRCVNAN